MYPFSTGMKVSLCKAKGEVLHLFSEYRLNIVASHVSLSVNLRFGWFLSQILYSLIVVHLFIVSLSVITYESLNFIK